MKRLYIKPETEFEILLLSEMITTSTNWNIQNGEGKPKQNIDGDEEPDPSGGAGAKSFDVWGEFDDDW